MKETFLNIQNLKKSFDGIVSVRDISLSVTKETISLITGENGAGKTTLFNLLTGLIKADEGEIIFQGENITSLNPLQIAQKGIVRLYQQPRLFKNLTVIENLIATAKVNSGENILTLLLKPKISKKEDVLLKQKATTLLNDVGLSDLAGKTAGELSYGQQKLISFCMIEMNEVKLALLDEPFSGLNPQNIDRLCNIILQMKERGISFIIIEHNLNKALNVSDKHFIMTDCILKEEKINKAVCEAI